MQFKSWLTMFAFSAQVFVCSVDARQTSPSDHGFFQSETANSQEAKGDIHSKHKSGVTERGDHAMGFSHEKTTHHFRLSATGGVIEVSASDAKDTVSLEQIRMHLSHIAKLFKMGDFNMPMFIHDKTPPGMDEMIRMKSEISYTYSETKEGAKVQITTSDKQALAAIHEFLRFQIKDHETGDPLEISPSN